MKKFILFLEAFFLASVLYICFSPIPSPHKNSAGFGFSDFHIFNGGVSRVCGCHQLQTPRLASSVFGFRLVEETTVNLFAPILKCLVWIEFDSDRVSTTKKHNDSNVTKRQWSIWMRRCDEWTKRKRKYLTWRRRLCGSLRWSIRKRMFFFSLRRPPLRFWQSSISYVCYV